VTADTLAIENEESLVDNPIYSQDERSMDMAFDTQEDVDCCDS
jgi:hypothetical protein